MTELVDTCDQVDVKQVERVLNRVTRSQIEHKERLQQEITKRTLGATNSVQAPKSTLFGSLDDKSKSVKKEGSIDDDEDLLGEKEESNPF